LLRRSRDRQDVRTADLSRCDAVFEAARAADHHRGSWPPTGLWLRIWWTRSPEHAVRPGPAAPGGSGSACTGRSPRRCTRRRPRRPAAAAGRGSPAGAALRGWLAGSCPHDQARAFAGEPAVDGLPFLNVELELARTSEMAINGQDIVVPRTRLTTRDAAL